MNGLPRVYLVTDRRTCGARDLPHVVADALAAVPPASAMVQLREKDLDTQALLALARRLRSVTRARRAPLLVNDRLDVALAAGADGVHLPEGGLDVAAVRRLAPELVVGVSTHTPEAAADALRGGADLAVLGPIWATPSKVRHGAPLGLDALDRAAALAGADAALFAIGGVEDPERAAAARARGAHGVAAIRALVGAADPGAALRAFVEAAR